jgi:hypothetical protein
LQQWRTVSQHLRVWTGNRWSAFFCIGGFYRATVVAGVLCAVRGRSSA